MPNTFPMFDQAFDAFIKSQDAGCSWEDLERILAAHVIESGLNFVKRANDLIMEAYRGNKLSITEFCTLHTYLFDLSSHISDDEASISLTDEINFSILFFLHEQKDIRHPDEWNQLFNLQELDRQFLIFRASRKIKSEKYDAFLAGLLALIDKDIEQERFISFIQRAYSWLRFENSQHILSVSLKCLEYKNALQGKESQSFSDGFKKFISSRMVSIIVDPSFDIQEAIIVALAFFSNAEYQLTGYGLLGLIELHPRIIESLQTDTVLLKLALDVHHSMHQILSTDQKGSLENFDKGRELALADNPRSNSWDDYGDFSVKGKDSAVAYSNNTLSLRKVLEAAVRHPEILLEIIRAPGVSNQQLHWLRGAEVKKAVRNYIIHLIDQVSRSQQDERFLLQIALEFDDHKSSLYRYLAIPRGSQAPRPDEPLQEEKTNSISRLKKRLEGLYSLVELYGLPSTQVLHRPVLPLPKARLSAP